MTLSQALSFQAVIFAAVSGICVICGNAEIYHLAAERRFRAASLLFVALATLFISAAIWTAVLT
jgi:hypothetical protein